MSTERNYTHTEGKMMDNETRHTAENDVAALVLTDEHTVCVAHGAFIPCRRGGEHRYTSNPFWVKAVGDYQSSGIPDLTWEPAWEHPAEKGLGRDELARALVRNDPDPCDPIEYDAAAYYRDFAAALLASGYRVLPPEEKR